MPSFRRPPVSSRAALTEIERQRQRHAPRTGVGPSAGDRQAGPSPEMPVHTDAHDETPTRAAAGDGTALRAAADKKDGASGGEPKKKGDTSKGSGQKDEVQRKPEDQKGRANPTEGEGRGAY